MIARGWCQAALVTCFLFQWRYSSGENSCEQLCGSFRISDGCKYSSDTEAREEVIVITNGTSDISSWEWDTITMVVSEYFSSTRSTGLTACYTHSKGKRYGLKERVPADIPQLVSSVETVKEEFVHMVLTYQRLLKADHMVFDLLDFFLVLDADPDVNRSEALFKMADVLSVASGEVKKFYQSEVYCIVPWQPPCDSDCVHVKKLLSPCDVLLLSPDSYMPVAPADQPCYAQATVPISRFLYGIDRYLSLKLRPYGAKSVVAGIPWHGYAYYCDQHITNDDKCVINARPGGACFSDKSRQRMRLTDIQSSMGDVEQIKMNMITKGIYYNLNATTQVWFENFTTLLFKYQLVQDLGLKGLSVWYGEDLSDKDKAKNQWNFLTHHVLHNIAFHPKSISHYYADTVAGVGVGCLLLGTILGVTFTCIGFQRERLRKLRRPFRLDEDDSAFRDEEGL